jgi:hypothetical protein
VHTGDVVQLLTAGIGVAGTLAAALFTQKLGRTAERERYLREDKARWLAERLRVNSRYLSGALALERELWSACAFLDSDERAERLAGFTCLVMTPEEGLPGIIDQEAREILLDATRTASEKMDELENLSAEITLIGTPEEGTTARELWERLSVVCGLIEAFRPFDQAADAVEECRAARDEFAAAARESLQVDGSYRAPDPRPRR